MQRCINLQDKYNWTEFQKYYDDNHSLSDCVKHFKVGAITFLRGSQKGLLKVRNLSDACKLRVKVHPNKPMSDANKKRLSKRQSLHNTGGKCKWYTVNGQKVQGSWERDVCIKLSNLGIKWFKPKANKDLWEYVDYNGKVRHYAPDLYLPDSNIWLEIKGYWWGNDKEKMNIVLNTYPTRRLIVITKHEFKKIMDGELVW